MNAIAENMKSETKQFYQAVKQLAPKIHFHQELSSITYKYQIRKSLFHYQHYKLTFASVQGPFFK
jgi:hypothetical protein